MKINQSLRVLVASVLGGAFGFAMGSAQAQDVDAGKQVFTQCAACHSIDGSNGAGPSLCPRRVGKFSGLSFQPCHEGKRQDLGRQDA